jgi:hypothetical protein
MPKHQKTSLGIILFPIAVLNFACSDGVVDLGGGTLAQDLKQPSRCAESSRITGDVNVANQAELAALAGCEEITGSLNILTFEGADLAPLASLRVVGEALFLGAQQDVPVSDDPDVQQTADEQYRALQDAGYLESLHGLESLGSVGRLLLTSILVEDLSELESLSRIGTGMVVRSSRNLRDLTGLEAAHAIPLVWLADCGALESLAGLELDGSTHSVYLERVPALANVEALGSITSFDTLIIDGTGIEALPAFSNFSSTDVYIARNLALVDASGLATIGSVRSLQVIGNPSLRALPALTQLVAFDSLIVGGNDGLEEVSLDFPGLQPPISYGNAREYQLSADLIEIGNNASLRRVTSLTGLSAVQNVSVDSNPSLTELDLGSLERTDLLAITDNAVLASVAAPSLGTVDSLEVVNNPLLVPTAFDDVLTFSRKVSGNAAPGAQP